MEKVPFDIDVVMERVAEAARPFPKAAMFELAEKGHSSPFEQLIGCILSIRTYDEVSLPVSLNLFARACKPNCRRNIGSKSTACWCLLASTSAPPATRAAPLAPSWPCASRSALKSIINQPGAFRLLSVQFLCREQEKIKDFAD
jgi:hypothetical protein